MFQNPHNRTTSRYTPTSLRPQLDLVGVGHSQQYLGPSWRHMGTQQGHKGTHNNKTQTSGHSKKGNSASDPQHKFFQTTDFNDVKKSDQRKAFFKQQNTARLENQEPWLGVGGCQTDRRDGIAERTRIGLTNADAALQHINLQYPKASKQEKKRAKQRRHRYNRAQKDREKRTAARRQFKIQNKVIHYTPTRRDKLRQANASRRREYRRFMRRMASDLSKRRGLTRLQEYPISGKNGKNTDALSWG